MGILVSIGAIRDILASWTFKISVDIGSGNSCTFLW
jgi:hypothetical protein